jgi:uncharacterized protein (DUF58 family)
MSLLRQRKIYVLPTKRGWGFLLTVGLMLLMSLNYALSLGFVLTFLWLGVVMATLAQTFRNLWGLEISSLAGGHAFAGGDLGFTLQLKSGNTARERILFSMEKGSEDTISLPLHDTRTLTLTRPTTYRGYLSMGRVRVETEAPLGLWVAWSYVNFPLRGIVFPAPELSPPPLPFDVNEKNGTENVGKNGVEDLAGLREYQPGDPIQRVAWKAVAKGGGWFTKKFEGGSGQQFVHLNYGALPSGMNTEAKLSRLTAWVLQCQKNNQPFALTLPRIQLAEGKGNEHQLEALTALALF